MSKIFVSYSRRSGSIAQALVKDLEALGQTVWFDQDLSGGQAWWDRILSWIRECDALVVVLDTATLSSIACQLEYEYAAALKKPILPILAADSVSTSLLPRALSLIEYVDYRSRDRDAVLRLARAFTALPAPAALPDPLPEPPHAPLSYLSTLGERISGAASLSYEDQSVLLLDLRKNFNAQETRNDARTLLERLRRRRDLFAAVAEEIDETLRAGRSASPVSVTHTPSGPPGTTADGRPQTAGASSSASSQRASFARTRLLWAAVGAVVGAIVLFIAIQVQEYTAPDWLAVLLLFGSVPWAIAGGVARGRRIPTSYAVASAVVGAVLAVAFARPDPILTVLFGADPGAILGAIAGAFHDRRRVQPRPFP